MTADTFSFLEGVTSTVPIPIQSQNQKKEILKTSEFRTSLSCAEPASSGNERYVFPVDPNNTKQVSTVRAVLWNLSRGLAEVPPYRERGTRGRNKQGKQTKCESKQQQNVNYGSNRDCFAKRYVHTHKRTHVYRHTSAHTRTHTFANLHAQHRSS